MDSRLIRRSSSFMFSYLLAANNLSLDEVVKSYTISVFRGKMIICGKAIIYEPPPFKIMSSKFVDLITRDSLLSMILSWYLGDEISSDDLNHV